MRLFRKRTPLWERGEDIYTSASGNVILRNAPINGDYRVIDVYGSPCLQSSRDGKNWVFVEIFDNGSWEPYGATARRWAILGKYKAESAERLLNVAREIRGEPCPVISELAKAG